MDIYAAREPEPEDGFGAQQIVSSIQHDDCSYTGSLVETQKVLLNNLGRNDVVVVLSAGNADQLNHLLARALRERSGELGNVVRQGDVY